MRLVMVVMLAGCGRLGFDPVGPSSARCEPGGTNDDPAAATPIALGVPIDDVLCPGDVDVFAFPLVAGDEVVATLTPDGGGWPSLEIEDDHAAIRATRTIESSLAGFADHDGIYYVTVAGRGAAAGTPYQLTVTARGGRHVFIAPVGNDSAAGTFAAPWQHFDAAISRLDAGDTLVLLDGTYPFAQNGQLRADCTGTTNNGTAAAPIRVTALTERRAKLASDGLDAPVRILACDYWTIEGLQLENTDNAAVMGTSNGATIALDNSKHTTIRRVLAAHNNRFVNAHLIEVSKTTDLVIEQTELYDFHRGGILLYGTLRSTIRQVFANSRGRGDITGGFVSTPTDKGDFGIVASHSVDSIVENNIDEGNGELGVDSAASVDAVNNRLYGNISHDDDIGMISSIETGGTQNTFGTYVENGVAIDSTNEGFYVRSNMGFKCVGCTSLRSGFGGWVADQISDQLRTGSSASCTACLVVDSASYGFRTDSQDGGWKIESSNSFHNAIAFDPAPAPELVGTMEIDPQLGGCTVYLPATSPMRTAGPSGTAVGAQVVYRYRDGAPTTLPLWDPETGAFPCGAVIAGVNDGRETSCIGVHERLHVGAADCPLPYPDP